MSHRISIVTPAPPGSRKGNRITAERWSQILKSLQHQVEVSDTYVGQAADILVALHARKSARSIARFHAERPDSPIIVALTGTDLYRDLVKSRTAQRSLDIATRLIVLQPAAVAELLPRWRRKAWVIIQSARPPHRSLLPRIDRFEVCVVGHLRAVKDPFRTALAARQLPSSSRVKVIQIGSALTPAMAARAKREMEVNPRYQWLRELSYGKAKQRMAQCRVLVLSSKLEGGANVISEAIVAGVPVIASRISGSIGLLGEKYPGYFETGDTRGLAKLLIRAEEDPEYVELLRNWCQKLRPLFTPEHETASWRDLLKEVIALR